MASSMMDSILGMVTPEMKQAIASRLVKEIAALNPERLPVHAFAFPEFTTIMRAKSFAARSALIFTGAAQT